MNIVLGPGIKTDPERVRREVYDSAVYTNDVLRPLYPLNRIDVKAAPPKRNIERIEGSHSGFRSIELVLGRASLHEILLQVRPTVLHEGTHMARFQYGIESGEYTNNRRFSLLDFVICEGVAVHAEVELMAEGYLSCFDEPEEKLKEVLREAKEKGIVSDKNRFRFMEGDAAFPKKGYKAGHFVVAAKAEEGLDLHSLIKLPYEDYRQKVEELIS